MERANVCRWYNESLGIKRANDIGLIDKKWVEDGGAFGALFIGYTRNYAIDGFCF